MKQKISRPRDILYNQKWMALVMGGPAILLLIVFLVLPFVFALFYSFTNRSILPTQLNPMRFIGLDNYRELVRDPVFYKALGNNLFFTAIAVPVQCTLALFLAILVNRAVRGIGIFRAIYYSPVVIPAIITSIMWALMLDPDKTGMINTLLSFLSGGHIRPLNWLYDQRTAMLSIIIMCVWSGVGYQMIIFLGGLQSIPKGLYEAASIDGANGWQQFCHVTLPELSNVTVFVFLSSTIMSFKLFTQVFALTGGGPRYSTTTIVYMIYSSGYVDQRLGYSSALSVVFFLIILSLSLVQQSATKMSKS